jgi:hypothetical protein
VENAKTLVDLLCFDIVFQIGKSGIKEIGTPKESGMAKKEKPFRFGVKQTVVITLVKAGYKEEIVEAYPRLE